MAYVYILKSSKDGGFYVGSTRNIKDRIIRHNQGRSKATQNRLPLELMYYKIFEHYKDAYRFEIYIKKQKSKKFIENLIENSKSQQ